MGKALIIVESPTKIKSLKKFLGKNYTFASSVGHIRDLPKKGLGVDVEKDFEPTYEVLPDKKDVIRDLKKAAKSADVVYLAPDPDREGEAIAWHIQSILPPNTKTERVTFNAITKDAVSEALEHPRKLDMSLVDAQQARRILDRLVGYKISPILQRRIQKGRGGSLSAGRVQSVALKLVVDREKEIDAFVSVEYWNIKAKLNAETEFEATLHSIDGKKIDKEPDEAKNIISIPSEKDAQDIVSDLKGQEYEITSVDKKERKRNPVPPFTTSTLQQEASRHYSFSSSRTMSIAQGLYEGVDLGPAGTQGLITYMRTDSVRVEPESIKNARSFIQSKYGKEYLPFSPKQYTAKKAAQDAHEAIRPTSTDFPPDKVAKYLSPDQLKLYTLVWRRFIASQMNPAIYDTLSCDIQAGEKYVLRTTGSRIIFPGFLAVYEEKKDSDHDGDGNDHLPDLKVGWQPKLQKITPLQSFTKPPPRFTEASLIRELERCGIGRPSTFTAIVNKITSRDYTTKERQQLKPTELGKIIAEMLENHFGLIMDIGFTASMEDELDQIASERTEWKTFLKGFWEKFAPIVESAVEEAFVPKKETDIDCPKCGSKLQKIWAKGKYFYGCSQYPECDFTTSPEALNFDKSEYADDFDWDQPCPKCSSQMTLRHGRFGAFLGCSTYPDCTGIVNIPKKGETPPEQMPGCPAVGCDGKIQSRRSRFGKTFFSCSNYPDCDVIVNDLDDLHTKYVNHPKTAYVKKTKGKKTKGASKKKKGTTKKREQPTYPVSKELATIIGKEECSRPEATKLMWDYIKKHNLQDPENKRRILPDNKLAKVFGSDEGVDMMKLAGLLSPHFKK